MSKDIAVSLTNVSKYYRLYASSKDRLKEALHPFGKVYHKKFYATKEMNLEIKKGEIVGIVGKNGSGKSTLLKLISGVLTPDEGSVKVNGNLSALLELGSGFNPEFTGMQNIYFYGTILGFTKKQMDARLDDILAFADIGEFIDQPLKTYSSGMKSRLGFAVAVHIDPEILILDEVLAVGDVLFRRKCYAKMEEFFKSGKTIIYVSHDENSINALCSRAILLDAGTVLMDDDAKLVTAYYQKLLFAKAADKTAVKKEIEARGDVRIAKEQAQNAKAHPVEKRAQYLPEFVSQSRVEYSVDGAILFDGMIRDDRGQKVNALVEGERYTYCFRVRFLEDAEQVSIGMQIKSEKGERLIGCGSHQQRHFLSIRSGDEYLVSFAFDCLFKRGIYYTNCGVARFLDGKNSYMHRVVDDYVFKIIEQPDIACSGGFLSLHESFSIEKIAER